MAIFYQLPVHKNDSYCEIPLLNQQKSALYQLKAYLSLKPAGDMAFFKRNRLPYRKRFFEQHAIDESRVYSLFQEHTHHVVKVEGRKKPAKYHSISGDGMVAGEKNIFLSVTVADCLPVFIIDRQTGAYGLVHSGWKGTGIVLKATHLMEKKYGSRKKDLNIIMGPGIGICCYAVPEKRFKLFASKFGKNTCRQEEGRYFIDMKKANLTLLENNGINDVDVITNCTCCDPVFHSFRRDGKEKFGLMMAVIGYFNNK